MTCHPPVLGWFPDPTDPFPPAPTLGYSLSPPRLRRSPAPQQAPVRTWHSADLWPQCRPTVGLWLCFSLLSGFCCHHHIISGPMRICSPLMHCEHPDSRDNTPWSQISRQGWVQTQIPNVQQGDSKRPQDTKLPKARLGPQTMVLWPRSRPTWPSSSSCEQHLSSQPSPWLPKDGLLCSPRPS